MFLSRLKRDRPHLPLFDNCLREVSHLRNSSNLYHYPNALVLLLGRLLYNGVTSHALMKVNSHTLRRRLPSMSWRVFVISMLAFAGTCSDILCQVDRQPQTSRIPVTIRGEDGTEIRLYDDSRALLIGVSQYKNGWKNLPGVSKDIEEIRTALEKQGFNVVVIKDPSRVEFDQAVRQFIRDWGQAENARLIIYFAGHGHTLKTIDGRDLGYIVPSDAPLPGRELGSFKEKAIGASTSDLQIMQRQIGSFKEKAVSMTEIENYALQIEAKHALFVFDSCFSGSLFDAMRGSSDLIMTKVSKPVRQFITAGTAEQTVPDESVFRSQFIEGVNGEADLNKDRYVTGSELGMFLEDRVSSYTGGTETPRYGKIRNPKLDKGDFVFVLPRVSTGYGRFYLDQYISVAVRFPEQSRPIDSQLVIPSVGKSVERSIKQGERHLYIIPLIAGQFTELSLDHEGTPITIVIVDPSGKKVLERISAGRKAKERVTFIAEASGSYQYEVQSLSETVGQGKYRLALNELRSATAKDRTLEEANRLENQVSELYASGKYRQALELGERVLIIRSKELSPDHEQVADALNNLGLIRQEIGDYENAEMLQERALAIRLKTLGSNAVAVATSLKNLAQIHFANGNYSKAEKEYLQALQIFESNFGRDNLEVADVINEVGSIYESKGDYSRSLYHYQNALSIRQKILGPNNPTVAASLNNLGLLYAAMGSYDQAEELLSRSLDIAEKSFGSNSPYVAQSLHNLGWIYYSRGQYVKAESVLQRAIFINESNLGPDHPSVAQSLDNLGAVYLARDNLAGAESVWRRSLTIREKANGPNHPDVARSLANLGSLAQKRGDLVNAKIFFERSLMISERVFGPTHPQVAKALSLLASVYGQQGDKENAFNHVSRALMVMRALGDKGGERQILAAIDQLGFSVLNDPARTEVRVPFSFYSPLEGFGTVTIRRDKSVTNIRLNFRSLPSNLHNVYVYAVDLTGKLSRLGLVKITKGFGAFSATVPLARFILLTSPMANLTRYAPGVKIFSQTTILEESALVQLQAATGERVYSPGMPVPVRASYTVPMLDIPKINPSGETAFKIKFADGVHPQTSIKLQKSGNRTEIKLHFRGLQEPQKEKKYILWAVSSKNQFQRLGEIGIMDGEASIESNSAFPDFGLLITSEDSGLQPSSNPAPSGPLVAVVERLVKS